MVDDAEDAVTAPPGPAPRRRRIILALVTVAVLAVAGVAVTRTLSRAVAGPRATSADGLFSVRVPAGWTEAPGPQPLRDSAHPDSGEMVLRGPSGREVDISWTDGSVHWAVNDATSQEVGRIPLTVAGQAAAIVDTRLTGISGNVSHVGYLDYRMEPAGDTGDPVRRTVHGRTVQFTARCAPAGMDDGYSWCVAILSSWQWE